MEFFITLTHPSGDRYGNDVSSSVHPRVVADFCDLDAAAVGGDTRASQVLLQVKGGRVCQKVVTCVTSHPHRRLLVWTITDFSSIRAAT